MNIAEIIQNSVAAGVEALYGETIAPDQITMNATRKEFEGDLTVVVFPFTRVARKKPEVIGEELGRYLVENVEEVARYNVIKGFLNLVISDRFWLAYLQSNYDNEQIGYWPGNGGIFLAQYQQTAPPGAYPEYPAGMGELQNTGGGRL